MVMQLGFRCLLLGLLVTIVLVHKEIKFTAATEEVRNKARDAGAGGSKWVGGRKMGVEDVMKMEAVKDTLSTGSAKNSSDALFGITKDSVNNIPQSRPSINTNMNAKRTARDPTNLSKAQQSESQVFESSVHASSPTGPPRPSDPSQTTANRKQNLQEATAELNKILYKDYHDSARRRPPVNN